MKRTLLSLGFMLVLMSGYSQANFKPGTVITFRNDTLKGFINFRDWFVNPDKITFKKELNSSKTVYTPKTIKEFTVDGEHYISAQVSVDTASRETSMLSENPQFLLKKITTFLLVIVSGEKNLYFYVDNYSVPNFFIGDPNHLELLRYNKYIINTGENYDRIGETKKYVGQLILYLNNCPRLTSRINLVRYKKEDLEHLFLQYYKCQNLTTKFNKKKEKINLSFGIMGGPAINTINFSGPYNDPLTNGHLQSQMTFSGGISFNITFPKSLKSWSLENELMYSSIMATENYTDQITADLSKHYDVKLGASYLGLNNLVRYTHHFGDFSIFANVGISNNFALNKTNYRVSTTTIQGSSVTDKTNPLERLNSYDFSTMAGLGLAFKKISLECRVEKKDNISDSYNFNSNLWKYILFVGYRF